MSMTGSERILLNLSNLVVSPTLPQLFHSIQWCTNSPNPLEFEVIEADNLRSLGMELVDLLREATTRGGGGELSGLLFSDEG
jgi:hypothetical protein